MPSVGLFWRLRALFTKFVLSPSDIFIMSANQEQGSHGLVLSQAWSYCEKEKQKTYVDVFDHTC